MKKSINTVLLFLSFLSFSSVCQTVIEKPIKIIKLSDTVYQHISYKHVSPWGMVGASGLILIDKQQAIIIDTPWTLPATKQLLAWIEQQDLSVSAAVVSHFHEDASAHLTFLHQNDIATYATTMTNKLLSENNRTIASKQITEKIEKLFDGGIEVFYPGAGHTQDNIVVWLPHEKILFGGCLVKSLKSNNLGNTEDANIKAWPKTIENIKKQYPEIKLVVPGHGPKGDKRLLTHTQQLALTGR